MERGTIWDSGGFFLGISSNSGKWWQITVPGREKNNRGYGGHGGHGVVIDKVKWRSNWCKEEKSMNFNMERTRKGKKKGKEVEGQEEEEEEWKKGERRRKDNGAPVGLFWCLV